MTRTGRYLAIALASALLALCGLGAVLAQETPPDGQPPAGDPGAADIQQPAPTQQNQLLVFFFKDGELTGVARDIPGGGQMVEFTVNDLLAGPTEAEQAEGYTSYLPEGLKLLYSTKSMTGSAFSVNLSGELMSLKETPEQAKMAMQQLVRTLKEAAHTEEVKVTVDVDEANRGVDAFEALGISSKDAGITPSPGSGGEGSLLWLWILIILAATLVILAVLIPLYFSNRRAEAALEQEIEEDRARRDARKN